jgi:pimeloyl-ACP methyl ester carboxylesterase
MSTSTGRTTTIHDFDMHHELHGQGEPLLLLHGFTGAGIDWIHVFDLAALARTYQLIIPDMRGHGRSTNPSGAFTHRQCALDVLALLDHLGVARCKAVGLSLGGNILLHMATRQPERVDSMILVSSPSYFPREARAIMAAMTVETRSEQEWQLMRARHVHGDEQIRALWRHGHAFKDSYDDMNFTPPYLSTIQARTMIVAGDRDPLYPVEIFVEMYRAIPRSSLWVVPEGGHGPIFGEWREAFVRAAMGFLGGEAGAR